MPVLHACSCRFKMSEADDSTLVPGTECPFHAAMRERGEADQEEGFITIPRWMLAHARDHKHVSFCDGCKMIEKHLCATSAQNIKED